MADKWWEKNSAPTEPRIIEVNPTTGKARDITASLAQVVDQHLDKAQIGGEYNLSRSLLAAAAAFLGSRYGNIGAGAGGYVGSWVYEWLREKGVFR